MRSLAESKRAISPDGMEIRYWVNWQKGMRDTFTVLHPGAALNHSSLERLEDGLHLRGIPTVVFDPRGSGYSDHPISREYFRLERLTDDLEVIAEQEGLERPCFVTHSFGFMPAVDYAVRTANAQGITGIGASHNFRRTAPNTLLFELFDKVLIHSEYIGSLGTLVGHCLSGTQRPACTDQSLSESEFQLWQSIVDIPLAQAASHVIGQRECNCWDITEQLGRLEAPVLLIHGEKDMMVRPVAGTYIEERTNAPCERYVVEGATHSLPVFRPETVLSIMDAYDRR